MPRFLLIDHSLVSMGGHNFDSDLHLLRAAEEQGCETALAAHRDFRDAHALPSHWNVLPVFRHKTYSRHAVTTDPAKRPANPFRPLPQILTQGALKPWLQQRIRLSRFARHLALVCRRFEIGAGDHVLFPTFSEFDLVGLARFLVRDRRARAAHWHLQTHFPFLEGRPGDYARQEQRIDALREHYDFLLRQLPDAHLHFYTPADLLAEQYNLLGVARFECLPYAVNPAFRPPDSPARRSEPLRVACAGGARHEKGVHQLEVVLRACRELVASGRVRFLVQAKEHEQIPAGAERVPHPLPIDGYVSFVRDADVGLFLYDGARYYARCSGILVEMLCSGVPVIVPAGNWLSEEIAGEIAAHREGIERVLRLVDERALERELAVPAQATHLELRLRCAEPLPAGAFLRVECSAGERSSTEIVGPRSSGKPVSALFPLPCGVRQLTTRWSNAYDQRALPSIEARARFLAGDDVPLGRTGLIAADPEQVAALLDDMLRHHDHYRASARAFAREYCRIHDPRHVLELLLEKGVVGAENRVAARAGARG